MVIDDQLISKLERLSRLELDENERESIKKDFDKVLDMFDKLKEVDTEGIEPLRYVLEEHNPPLREDIIGKELNNDEALLNAEENIKPFFIVPKFLKK